MASNLYTKGQKETIKAHAEAWAVRPRALLWLYSMPDESSPLV